MSRRALSTFAVATVAGAAIWALSAPVTGAREPWDSDGPYYVLALAAFGALSGALAPKPLWAQYLGAFVGQAGWEVLFLPIGPLFGLGLVFLLGYGVVFAGAAAIGGYLRARARRFE